ncbi:MAG: hypothetical protein PHH85_14650 [Candidatus Methanoperedens sp.]|nr:hypothetical protein [Candidatus Methanoperedens sp.]
MAGEAGREFKRTSVFRMFAAELRNTTHTLDKNGGDPYESQYFLTPSGEAVSKVMMVGVAIEKEDIGTDQPFWRMRISDPTGGIMVYAGQYQAEAAQIIGNMKIPCIVAVVGKPKVYEPDGGAIVSIRPDTVVEVDDAARSSFIVDAAGQLLSRVKEMKATPDAERIKRTRAIYESITPAALLDIADMAVKSLLPQQEEPEKEKGKGEQKDAGAEQKAPAPEQKPPEQKAPANPEDKPGAKPPADKKSAKRQSSNKPAAKKEEPKPEPSSEDLIAQAKDYIYRELLAKKHLNLGKIPEILTARGLDPNKVDWEIAVKKLMHEGMCVERKLGELNAV